MFVSQTGVAVLETDYEMSDREHERILAQLQSIGIKGIILPMGVTLAHVAMQGMDDEDDE